MNLFNLILSKFTLTAFIAFYSSGAIAQMNSSAGWSLNPYEKKVFIENKGQFTGQGLLQDSEIKYGVENLGTRIFFTSKGLTFRFDKITFNPEGDERNKESMKRLSVFMVNIEWLNSNPDVQIIADQPVTEYFNYEDKFDPVEKSIYHARAFEKLTYKNLYEGIDVEYVFHPQTGIKYTLIIHPGADLSQVSMKYTGNENMQLMDNGNLHITTPAGAIIDHSPVSWTETKGRKHTVISAFILSGNTVSFKVGKYDRNKTLIVDPWTIIPTELGADLRAFNVQKDDEGNVYVYGGSNFTKVQKYDASGAPLWTYSTVYSCVVNCGSMVVDPSGNVYITNIGHPTELIVKLDKTGTVKWKSAAGGLCEGWTLSFNCNYTRLAIGTGCGSGNIIYLNCANGATVGTLKNISGGEIRALTTAPNGDLYALSFLASNLIAMNPSLNILYNIPSAYVFNYLGPNYTPWSQQNAIAANLDAVYTSNGTIIYKRERTTGALQATAVIPGGVAESNSGITVDSCGFVYAGSQGAVYRFDADLIPSGLPAIVPGSVFDVKIGSGGEVLACGNGFVASLGGMNACKANVQSCCPVITLGFVSTNTNCNGNNGSATVNPVGGNLPYTYLWNTVPPQTAQTAINLGAGTYTCTVTDAGKCQKIGTVTIENATGLKDTIVSKTDVLCHGGNSGSATAAASGGVPGYTYSWNTNPVQTTATAINLKAGVYTCTVTDDIGCTASTDVTIEEPFKMAATIFSHTDVSCNGGNDGAAQLSIGGGTGPYTVSWNTSPEQNSVVAMNLKAGTYIVTVTDKNNCIDTDTVIITEPPAINISESHTDVFCKGEQNGTATIDASGGTPPYAYLWNTVPEQTERTAVGLAAGDYTVQITDVNGCQTSRTVFITEPELLTAETVSSDASCFGKNDGTASVSSVSGGTPPYSYLWNSTPAQSTQTAVGLMAGTYNVTITDKNGCVRNIDVSIDEPDVLTAILSGQYAECPLISDTLTVQINGGVPPYNYLWTPEIGSGPGPLVVSSKGGDSYFVTVTDGQLCSAVSNVLIPVHDCYFFHIPEAFTPNGDGTNDVFIPNGEGIHTYSFHIYNRWGEAIFQTTDFGTGWNGTVRNNASIKAPAGVYIYIIKANDQDGKLRTYQGTVYLNE